jgi:hypothetical protein
MKYSLTLLLFAVPLYAQQVPLENFTCATGTVTGQLLGGPTTIQCQDANGNPQNLVFPAGSHIIIWGATGNWKPLNTQSFQIMRWGMSSTDTTMILNDTGMMENTPGSTWQIYPESGQASCSNGAGSQEIVKLVSIVDGYTTRITRGTSPGPTASPHCVDDYVWGPLNRPVNWAITIVDSTHFSVPLDSSAFGSFAGQAIHIMRASAYAGQPVPVIGPSSADDSPPTFEIQSNNLVKFTIAGCPDKTNAVQCSLAYNGPVDGHFYGDRWNTSSLVVTGGTGTLSLTSNFNGWNATHYTRTFQANEFFWLLNFSDPRINRGWVTGSVTGTCTSGGCTVTIPNMGTGQGGTGVPDGTYTVSGSDLSGYSFVFPVYADYYTWWGPGNARSGNYPTEYPAHMVEGPFSNQFNRFRSWFCWSSAMTAVNMEFGSYVVEQPSATAYHGYHTVIFDTYGSAGACQWQLYEINSWPLHLVGNGNQWFPQGTDGTYTGWVGPTAWTGEKYHYFDINYTFYMNMNSVYAIPGAQTSYLGPMYMDTVTGEPEEWVLSRSSTYNPGSGKFHLNIVAGSGGGPNGPCANLTYNFYYSTSELKALGLNNATFDGSSSAVNYGVNGIYQVNHDTAAIPYGNMYFGVQPRMCISGVSPGGQSPVVVSFRQDPNMQVGDHVTISGVGGNTAANQSNVQITNVYPRQFWYRSNQGYAVSQASLTNIVANGGVCTVNLTVTPGVVIGQEIGVTSAPAAMGLANPNGMNWYSVTGVSGNTFTYSCPSVPNATYNTDYGSGYPMGVVADPAIAINGTGNGNWDGQFTGTMVSSENNKNFAEIAFTPPAIETSSPQSPCDLNGDGVVDVTDVNLSVQAALGAIPCTADLQRTGTCNVVDVQRVINYITNGGVCKVGP